MSMNYEPKTIEYTIQAGDTLWDLANEFNTTEEAIVDENPDIDFDDLYEGDVILIPDNQPMSQEQFRRFGPGFGRPFGRFGPGFRRPFGRFGPGFRRPFRRFGPGFGFSRPIGPVVVPVPVYACSPFDPYCPYF